MRLASIDIGSNAVRLLLADARKEKSSIVLKKIELVRIPLRMGEDAFTQKKIGKEKIKQLVTSMKAFRYLMDAYQVEDYRACATASLREANNSKEIVRQVAREAKIKIEVIDGRTEADLIYSNHKQEKLDKTKSYLYIDIGGGSTELTLFSKGKTIASQSFNIGTIRLLHKQVSRSCWNCFIEWMKQEIKSIHPLIAIGSGGNINKMYKMLEKKNNKFIPYKRIVSLAKKIESLSYTKRIKQLGLNADRADVIVPAANILLAVMKTAKIDKLMVPQTGLADGIARELYEQNNKRKVKKGNLKKLKHRKITTT